MRFSLRAFFAAATAVYAAGTVSAQPPTAGPPRDGEVRGAESGAVPGGQAAVTSTILNTPEFAIPFSVDSLGGQPVEVQLYVSRDAGAQWEFIGRQSPGSREFPFQAASDGDYWFATRTIDSAGTAHPSGQVAPQLRVTVDTTNPQLEAKADADSNGEITVTYRISDASPHADGMRVEYMTDAVHQWMPVEAAAPSSHRRNGNHLEGRVVWVPESEWRHVSIRIMVRDQAGNQTVLVQNIQKPRIAKQRFQLASRPEYYPDGTATTPSAAAPYAARPPQYPNEQYTSNGYDGGQVGINEPNAGGYSDDPLPIDLNRTAREGGDALTSGSDRYAPDRFASNQLRGLDYPGPTEPTPSPTRLPVGMNRETKPEPHPQAESEQVPTQQPQREQQAMRRTIESATRPLPIEQIPPPTPQRAEASDEYREDAPIADDQQSTSPATNEQTTTPIYQNASLRLLDQLPQGSLVRRSNTRTFSLDYEIDAVGSQGLDSIELWCTKDGGQTWKYWDKDPDRETPFDIITADEGLYGFRMVVVGGNGLTSPRPVAGDNADIYVVVDTEAPEPRITGARYGEGEQTGKLVISYRCDETNEALASRPIRLAFAEQLDGPWTTIATGLSNDGQYVWPADPQLPRRIYLRIEATDKAGNVGTDTLDTPIDVQGLAPRARIRGFQPVTETANRSDGRIR